VSGVQADSPPPPLFAGRKVSLTCGNTNYTLVNVACRSHLSAASRGLAAASTPMSDCCDVSLIAQSPVQLRTQITTWVVGRRRSLGLAFVVANRSEHRVAMPKLSTAFRLPPCVGSPG
jgi:hypothetical protein